MEILFILTAITGIIIACIKHHKNPPVRHKHVIPKEEIILDLHMCGATERAEHHDNNYETPIDDYNFEK